MEGSQPIILPEELRNAPEDIQQAYFNWVKLGEEVENHVDRFLVLSDKHGEAIQIDCSGVLPMNIRKAKRLGVWTKEVEQ